MLRVGVGVEAFVGDARVEAVRLTDGSRIPADLVVIGLGVTPATEWLKGSGLHLDEGVVCDATGAAEGASGVVAVGDVARWWHPLYERHLRIEHWDHAGRQGEAAARTLLAGPERADTYHEVPYFWSDQYDVKMQMLGVPTDYDTLDIVEGDPDDWEFVAAYGRDGRTIAVLGTIRRARARLPRGDQQGCRIPAGAGLDPTTATATTATARAPTACAPTACA